MLIDEISVGSNIELEVRCNGQNMTFHNKVDLIKGNSILINPIKVNDQTVGFSDKCRINFLYKIDNRLFIWENANIKLVKYQSKIYHKVDLDGIGRPHNRREAFRMYIGEDMPISIYTPEGPTQITVLLKDISEIGVGFITHEDIDTERTIRFKLKDYNNIISLTAVIIRKEFIPHINSYIYGCKFNQKNSALGNYIAKKQGEQMNKKVINLSSPPTKDINISKLTSMKNTP